MGNEGQREQARAEAFWRSVYRAAAREAVRWARRDTGDHQEVVQEAIVRFYLGLRRRRQGSARRLPVAAAAWVRGIARHVALDRLRRRGAAPASLDHPDLPDPPATATGPTDAVEQAERVDRLRRACTDLPRPCAQIAALRTGGATRRHVAAYLHAWRGVGPHESRRLGKVTLRMLRTALEGGDLREHYARWFSKKNAWNSTPPPPLPR